MRGEREKERGREKEERERKDGETVYVLNSYLVTQIIYALLHRGPLFIHSTEVPQNDNQIYKLQQELTRPNNHIHLTEHGSHVPAVGWCVLCGE